MKVRGLEILRQQARSLSTVRQTQGVDVGQGIWTAFIGGAGILLLKP